MTRPAKVGLDLVALRNNLLVARQLAPASKVMAVIKANAYGHGAVPIAQELQGKVDALAVACIEEAAALRDAGITAPILLLEGLFEAGEVQDAAGLDCWVAIENEQQLSWLQTAVLDKPLHCWLKVDTGMCRLGVAPTDTDRIYQRLKSCRAVHDDIVVFTHFASADELHSRQTSDQLALFDSVCSSIEARRSAANSPAVLAWPASHYDWVRPGYMLYGNSPFAEPHPNDAGLKPVMTFSSAIISLRDVAAGEAVGYGASWVAPRPSRIATVAVGYGDGYPRQAPSGTPVLVNGQRALLAGRVSMDLITVDVTDLDSVKLGDEVVLWGKGLPVGEVAVCAGTIGYELTTRMPTRVPRIVIAR